MWPHFTYGGKKSKTFHPLEISIPSNQMKNSSRILEQPQKSSWRVSELEGGRRERVLHVWVLEDP